MPSPVHDRHRDGSGQMLDSPLELKEFEVGERGQPGGDEAGAHAHPRGEAKAERAKKGLIEANLRLVVSIAKKYTNRRR